MNFREMVEEDTNVFLNLEEFAENLKINNVDIVGMFSDDKFAKNNNEFGAFTESKLLSMKESDFNLLSKPKVNDELRINGKRYLIKSVNNKLGVTEFRLEANRS